MGTVGGDPDALSRGGGSLRQTGSSTRRAAAALDDAAGACAAALDGPLAEELCRFAAATACFTTALALHVETTGWLAENLGADLARVDGRP